MIDMKDKSPIKIIILHCNGCNADIEYNIAHKPQIAMDKLTGKLFYLQKGDDIRGKDFYCDCGSNDVKLKTR